MNRLALLALVGTIALASCNQAPDVSGKSVTKSFTDMKLAGYTAPSGTAKYVDLNSGDRVTTLTVKGLLPNKAYLAHYHAMGTASTDPCKSGGAVVPANTMIGMTETTDANGNLTIKGLQATAALKDAKYINVHEASALANVPVCAPL
ncbi:CHRD domain-containing protein [Deinococcus aquaticus]|uniref:CHRD domain-containing protein n=1 Tax=Deinococcus aquaticus TaxID=328692 RepID=UPI003F45FF78